MAEEIKPCPFCDGKGYVICGSSFKFGFTSYAVECEKCGAVGAVKASEQEAIETWNTRAESVRRIEDSDLPKTSPLPGIPRIRVYDGDGRKCAEGYYVFHQNRQLCVFGDKLKPDDCDHLIVADGFADWNMPRGIEVKKIVADGGWIEVASDAD